MKSCTKCHTAKTLHEFPKNKGCSDGRGSWCVLCSREYSKEYYRQRRATVAGKAHSLAVDKTYRDNNRSALRARQRERLSWIYTVKSIPCTDCRKSFPSCCMDFDHVRGVKSRNISRMHGCSRDRILAEIEKCDIVCACCHRIRTISRRSGSKSQPREAFLDKINSLKQEPCEDCGLRFAPEAMDFDHVRGSKIKEVSLMTCWGWGKVLLEVSKCDLVCACCHRNRTQSRFQKTMNL